MTETMPAISLWQPWASLLFTSGQAKEHETRHWPAPARLIGKRVAVHAAKRMASLGLDEVIANRTLEFDMLASLSRIAFGTDWRKSLPRGAFVGTAILASCKLIDEDDPAGWAGAAHGNDWIAGNWASGRYAWLMTERRPLATPIPARGQQGWWTIPTAMLEI